MHMCVCVRERGSGGGGGGVYVQMHECVHVCCFLGADGCILLTMLTDACQCCHLLTCFYAYLLVLPPFKTLSLL